MSVYTSNGRRYSKRIRFMSDKKKINPNSHKLDECCENGIYKIKEYGGKCSKCLKHSNPELFKKLVLLVSLTAHLILLLYFSAISILINHSPE